MSNPFSKYTDSELYSILAKKNRDSEKAFAELYSRHSNKVYAYCTRLLNHRDIAADAFQDTFFNFYNTASEEHEILNISSFIMTIARNSCYNYSKKFSDSDTLQDVDLPANDLRYEEKQLLDLIRKTIKLLDFEDREILILRLYHGLNYSEISTIVRLDVGAIRTRFWRAKEHVKDILKPYLKDLQKWEK